MKLTKIERLILINQYQIMAMLESLNIENMPDYLGNDYDSCIKSLIEGYESEYSNFINLYDPISEKNTDFVLDVLNMYSDLIIHFKSIDKAELGNKQDIIEKKLKFPGFDGNNEYKEYSYSKYLIENDNSFKIISENLENNSINSHRRLKPKYKKMLDKYHEVKFDKNLNIGLEAIEYILDLD